MYTCTTNLHLLHEFFIIQYEPVLTCKYNCVYIFCTAFERDEVIRGNVLTATY